MNNIITLFDMDGTLTEPRQSFDTDLFPILSKLADVSDIGIVSGSDYGYIQEQLHFLMHKTSIRYQTHILPCNGTKHYTPPKHSSDDFTLKSQVDMWSEIGEESFRDLMNFILKRQSSYASDLPCLSGHFVDYRGSMINWCPIGRNANDSDRERFAKFDGESSSFRTDEIKGFKKFLHRSTIYDKVEIKLGGETSYDIFPKGWDKTFALQHFEGYQWWFVWNRYGNGRNDQAI